MNLGVVVPCYRQERFLARTVAALERALAGRTWAGVLVMAAPAEAGELPPLSAHWAVLRPRAARPLTPGAARNLGLAANDMPWVLFVDADVEVDEPWLSHALAEADRADETLGGMWGRLEEWFVDGAGERMANRDMFRVGDTDHDSAYITMPALYCRAALAKAGGYEPRLNSEEDFELGLRLRQQGFRLKSLAGRAARHWSAPRPSFSEIGRRWSTGLCFGGGQVLRLYLGRDGLAAHLRRQAHYFGTLALWLAAIPAFALFGARGLGFWVLVPLAVFALMTARKRSARLALHSLLTWTVHAAGLVVGFVRGGAPLQSVAGSESAC
jgi:hypothetical protein